MIFLPLNDLKKLHFQNKAEYNKKYYTLDENRRKRFYIGGKNGKLLEILENNKQSTIVNFNEANGDFVESVSDNGGLIEVDNTDFKNPIVKLNSIIEDALNNSNSPNSSNPFATVNDLPSILIPHATTHVDGTDDIQLANSSQKGLLSSTDWTTFNNKQNALGYTPLNPANNLSDVSNAVTAKDNLHIIDKRSTADLVTASTSLSTITGLSVTLSANKTYVFEASGSVSNSAANGCRLGVNFPSGTCTLELTAASTAITNQTSESADYTTTGGVEIVRTFASVATTRLWWKISGVIEVGSTGGTFAIMGKTVNVANTATFHQRSRLSVRIIN